MAFKGWEKRELQTEQGETVTVSLPVIVSASRSTDIPAFHADWFMDRLRKGYIKWVNPFNAAQPQYVAFDRTRVIVFWSKNPRSMLRYIDELDERGLHYYFTYTLNDYGLENFEPNVPSVEERVDTFYRLADRLGKERVIWRFDPLVLTDQLSVDELLRRMERIGDLLQGYTEKLVISFADIDVYPKVQHNLARLGIHSRSLTEGDMRRMAEGIAQLNKRWKLTVATCGEAIDLESYGIVHNRCIDDELMLRCFSEDDELMRFLGVKPVQETSLFGEEPRQRPYLKDMGQRRECGCIVSKDIGQYNTCRHLCAYCYANTSSAVVERNFHRLSRTGETILRPAGMGK